MRRSQSHRLSELYSALSGSGERTEALFGPQFTQPRAEVQLEPPDKAQPVGRGAELIKGVAVARKRHALHDFNEHWSAADDEARRSVLREDLRMVILALGRDAEVSDAYVREGLGCLKRLREVCVGRREAEFDAFLLGALAESKVDNPDWEDALEGQEPFAGGAAPAEVPFADDGPDTQSHQGDDDDDDFD